jgi:hypothetical protein
MQTQFFWIRCEKSYNFCYTHLVRFLIFFNMKNRNLKTLDVLYLKIHKSSVANCWICCVLCHD